MKDLLSFLRFKLFLALALVMTLSLATNAQNTVVDVIVNSPNHQTLEAAVIAADLADVLSGEGPFTVFAPTDAAFAALPAGTIEALLADPSGDLTDILKYHVLAGKVLSTGLSNGMTATTLLGKDITVTINDDGVFINDAEVTFADIVTDNGVVHVIDAVLVPARITVVDVVVNSDVHTTLEAAVVAAGLAEALSGDGPFTVFAPTDAAFAALPAGTVEALLADPSGALTDILTYHVLSDKVMSTDLSDGMTATTLLGKDITVTINDDGVFINDAEVTFADIVTDNGVVHVIDAVLVPARTTVVDVIVNSEVHTTLEAAVVAAGLVDALSGDGPFTVFAPTDAAFAALPAGTVEALLADPTGALAEILTYHVLSGKVMSTDLSDGMTATTLLGKDITVTINDDGVFINDAEVTFADIVTDNGVVHVIDAVLVPRTTVVDVVVNSGVHTILEAAVVAAGLVDALSGDGPFTVFAPTDAAFAAVGAETIEALLADPSGLLTQILLYHVVGASVMSTDLSDGMKATTLLGEDITVTFREDGIYINDAKVTFADIEADNGVVHVIDAVILPPASVQLAENPVKGSILTDSRGKTLYFHARDAKDISNCTGGCLNNWPVFYDANLRLGEGLDAEDFGTIDRGAGVMQTTYKGWPLYYFVQDTKAGDVAGDGRAGVWFVAKPDYTIMLVNNQMVGFDGNNYKGDYTQGDEIIQYFTDAYGRTLYTYSSDFQNDNNFTYPDFKNNFVWPIYEMTDVVIPSILDASLFSITEVYGRKQLTYKGWPLYSFGADNMVRGSTKGVSLPVPGTWPVARQNMEAPLPATVVDIVVGSEVHTTLTAAVVAAGLVEALKGDGPFTVFAPTDAAFAALPAGTIEALLSDPSGLLTQILLYHVVGGNVLSTDLSDGMKATTLLGEDITVTFREDGVYINDAKVIVADLIAGNGVVHVIDAVILPPASVQIAEHPAKGSILTDSRGMTLYTLSRDAKDISTCTGTCLNNWPVFYDANLRLGEGLDSDDFGSIDRGDGVMQTTYKGWPLYYYVQDTKAGDVAGDGRAGVWFVAKPDYTIMLVNNQLVGNDGNNYKGDYTQGDEVIQYFTDSYGRTLYTWSRDFYNTNKFTRADFSNNNAWPVYEEEGIVIPSILDASLFSSIDVHGRRQMTYKGWPLYYFGADGTVRGSTKGVSVPMPGVWPVARQNMNAALPATVVDIVVASEEHTTLTAAVVAAGLVETLSGTGPFTVFAPTDAAFAALPEGTVEALLADIDALTNILTYHVVGGKAMSTDLSDGLKVKTIQGKNIVVTFREDGIYINEAKVTVADLVAGNGVVHVIDAVLIPEPPKTVVDVVVGSADHTTLEAAVIAAGLVEALSSEGPFTVFAPTDAAFAALPAGTIEALLADPTGALADILKYHVLAGMVMSTDLSDGMTATTLLGKDITVTINDDGVFINGAKVTVADIEADNGVVHVIDAVLVPARITVVDVVVNSDVHTTLETAVIAAGLAEALSGDGPFTVFAPTDAAFAALPAGTVEALLADPTGALADILKYHVLAGKVMSTDLSDGMTATTLLGKDITVTINDDGVFINGAKVIVADIETDNGVVHVIDAVLVPARITVVDVVVNSEVHTTLEAAVVAAGLVEALSGDGPFTVFAPTDAAFAALPAGTVEALLADPTGALANILKYHVLAGKVMSTDLSDGMTATTLLGKDITVTINDDGVFINGAKVIVANIETDNGVVHVIDAVLVPRTTVVDVIVNSEVHTTLEAAVVAAGLVDALSGDGPFTVFAPTDAAFAALPAGTVEALLGDPTGALADILKYHVVSGKVMSGQLTNEQKVTTLSGKIFTVTINADGVFINKSKVIIADIETDNGVVHVIDAVLIADTPTNVVDIFSGESRFGLYPNPASSNVTIDLSGTDLFSPATISIVRADGKVISEFPIQDSIMNYNVGNLNKGMYIVVLKQENRISTEKLIVR